MKAFEIVELIKNGKRKAVDIVEEALSKADNTKEFNIFNSIDREKILTSAMLIDKKSKSELGKLAGIPIVIKDNILVEGEELTCSSKMLRGYIAKYDATVIERIRREDGIVFGKSNLDEFAMGSSTENSAFGSVKNPWDKTKVPGGSSGGSAAAVAAGIAPLALGSDTGGSVRQPAAFCGILGLKPTYGRVSRYGLVSLASSLDQIGPFSRDVKSLSMLYETISGFDRRDSTSVNASLVNLGMKKGKLKIGVIKVTGLDREIMESLDKTRATFEELGYVTEEIEMKTLSHSIEAYYIINPAELSSNLSRLDGLKYGLSKESPKTLDEIYTYARTEGFGDEVKRRILIGNYVLSSEHYNSYYRKAYEVRRVIKDEFVSAFTKFDMLLCPTTPSVAFGFKDKSDPVKMYFSDIFTVSVNIAGLPAISFPSFFKGLPIGMQLIGNYFQEHNLLNSVEEFEAVRGNITYPEATC